MGEYVTAIIAFAVGGATALLIGAWFLRRWIEDARTRRQRLISYAEEEANLKAREIEMRTEQRLSQRESSLAAREQEIAAVHESQQEELRRLEARDKDLTDASDKTEREANRAERMVTIYRQRLQQLSGLTSDEVREALVSEVQREVEDDIRALKARLLEKEEAEIEKEAKRIIIDSVQRLSYQTGNGVTATHISLPEPSLKGRLIGREGRNIKAFEMATGVNLVIDDTPDSVMLSSFDPVRREVARMALEALIRDGRIHPASIEEMVQDAENNLDRFIREQGEQAIRRLKLTNIHPELVSLLGALYFRLSNNQNSLDHSVECAELAGMIAHELDLDPEQARRAALLHDIGKAIEGEFDGSHAAVGARLLERVGEDPLIVNAVAASHEEVQPESPYATLVQISDALSASRPGARVEAVDSYFQRVERLESLAKSFEGIEDAYALHAGREVRVIVNPNSVNDAKAKQLSHDLRSRIENELDYPGTVRVTVIRESRYSDTAH